MKKALLMVCLVAGAALAGTKSYNVTIFEPSIVGGTELAPGTYKAQVTDQKLVLTHGATTAEVPVTVETVDRKFDLTTVQYASADSQHKVQEIRLGGTRMKVVLTGASAGDASGSH